MCVRERMPLVILTTLASVMSPPHAPHGWPCASIAVHAAENMPPEFVHRQFLI
jgi:hypothetical protein